MQVSTEAGFTLTEMIATVGLVTILSTIAISNFKELENPVVDASYQVSRFIRLARSRAISQTIAIVIQPDSTTELVAFSSDDCNGTLTSLGDLSMTLPDGALLSDTEWSTCFTQRGLSDTNVTFQIQDVDGKSRTIEIALGGGVQVQ
ncbi:GspH/FimT family pseudopilin [bacterium]|nr:GspH/FimT family pseudopilin [bacterium]